MSAIQTNPTRLSRLHEKMVAHQLEALLILNVVNIRYLCGFTGSAGVLLLTGHDATLFVDGRYTEQAEEQVTGVGAEGAPRPVLPYVLDKRLPSTVKRLGIEADHVTVAQRRQIQELIPAVELVHLQRAVEELRAVKDETELALMRRAIAISDEVFDAFCGWIEPGMTENDVAARLEYEQRLAGGERNASGMTIVASGPRTSLPHGIATHKRVEAGEPVMIDIGTAVGGYCSDLTRTIHLGTASQAFKELYQLVYDAQQRAVDDIRAGMTGIEADALAREVIARAGYADNFDHSLAHAIGLDVHERPFLNPRDSSIIQEHMVFTIEPGVYIPGWAGVRIEDVVLVTANGCEVLTNSNRRLIEL